MAQWAILSAPLFISADLRFMNSESESILLNSGSLSMNQDALGDLGMQIHVVCVGYSNDHVVVGVL